ncbi:ankyrin repeat domain-containing protein 54-like [Clytia hemisphaerica]|uniref:ankyrin repeat domain-containing protein 54-like n=1 Tax=Clytia hemisphaerica TaxID=252671 RepID=UPI0034D66BF8
MSIVKKELLPIPPPEARKQYLVCKLLKEATVENDWTLVDFMLRHCWNKERIFVTTSKDGMGLLHHAVQKDFPNTVRVLIEHGINVNYRNKEGNTCLHVASQLGNEAILDLLMEGGSNPFIENSVGKQPIDCVNDKLHFNVKEKLRKYSLRCSRVKLMKNLETWKNILAEEERKETLVKTRLKERKPRRKTSVMQVPNLQRTDSGIISDFGSEKSIPVTSTVTSQSKQIDEKENEKKLGKSKSFSVKDIASQYNTVTNALRKLSSNAKNDDVKPSEIKALKKNRKSENRKQSGGGLKVSEQYEGEQKKTSKKRKKIDRTQRMSLPLFPIFAPPESYI